MGIWCGGKQGWVGLEIPVKEGNEADGKAREDQMEMPGSVRLRMMSWNRFKMTDRRSTQADQRRAGIISVWTMSSMGQKSGTSR